MADLPSRCAECASPLAHDQRYCLRCGHRRGPLPAPIGLAIGEIHERGRPRPRSGAELTEAPAPAPARPDDLVGAARSASVAILLMIAFGCIVGSLTTPGGVESLARALVVAVKPAPAAPAPIAATGKSGGGNDGSSNAGGSAPASAAAAPAAAPAAVPQQTVTVGSSDTPTSASTTTTTPSATSLLGLPPIKHVWEIVLSQQGYHEAFATSQGHPYLATQLRRQGELITDYYGVAGSPLANEIALISGQGPTPQTVADCPTFSDITPATVGHFAQVKGAGCLYPESTLTLLDQLTASGMSARAYVEGIGEPASTTTSTTTTTPVSTTAPLDTTTAPPTTAASPTTAAPPTTTTTTTTSTSTGTTADSPAVPPTKMCPHPPLNGPDANQAASVAEPYATWRNPFVYFRSVLIGGHCAGDDVGLSRLGADLKQVSTTPAFSYVSPGPCDDGSDTPCSANAPAGLTQADRFLKTVVPEIERSPAYKQDGLIVITFDGAPTTGANADLTSCCDQPKFRNLPAPSSSTSSTGTDTNTTTTTTPSLPPSTTSTCSSTTSTTGATTPAATSTIPSTTTTTTTTSTASGCTPVSALPPGTNPGGGQVGLLLISRYVKPNSVDEVDTFNHFSLLKSIEDLFGLKPLGYGRDTALPVFDSAIFNAAKH